MVDPTVLVLLRHGQTEWNDTSRMQGQIDTHLDETGVAQVNEAAHALRHRKFQAIYSSDLSRAYESAQILAENLGIPVTSDPRLQEIHMGSWSGRTLDDVVAEFPEFASLYREGKDFRRSPTGETVADMVQRAMPAIGEIVQRHRGGEVLLVAHGFMISQLSQHLVGVAAHARVLGNLGNANWTEIGVDYDDRAWIICHNVGPHPR